MSAARDTFIPVRKSDIVAALSAQIVPDVPKDKLALLCKMLGAIYHYAYFDKLERLRADYFYFNPEIDPHAGCDAATLERTYADLQVALRDTLKAANFVEISHDEIEAAHRSHAVIRVETRAETGDFREIRFFRRGHRREHFEIRDWFGLRKRVIDCDVYDDVVLFAAVKPGDKLSSKRDVRRFAQHQLRPGSVLIKYFRGIASADLNALFPNVRVVMSNLDKLVLGIPAIAGGVPIILNLVPAFAVLFAVVGVYLGFSGTIHEDDSRKALAALSGLAALGGFLLQQWIKYQRQSLKYQKLLSDNVYFRNVNNNAGIFDYLIGMAEEQESKEALLAYHFLLAAKEPVVRDVLDDRIEAWLRETFAVEVDFEVADALGKLERFGLLVRSGEAVSVLSIDEAITRLDRVWDGFFDPVAGAPRREKA